MSIYNINLLIFLFICSCSSPKKIQETVSLQELVNKASDTLHLEKRKYLLNKSVKISKPLTIIGNGAEIELTALDQNAFFIASDNVNIYDLSIKGCSDQIQNKEYLFANHNKAKLERPYKKDMMGNSGIRINTYSNITIENCQISHCIGNGISLHGSNQIVIRNNTFFENAYLSRSSDINGWRRGPVKLKNILIEKNRCLSNNREGISIGTFGGVENIEIYDNEINAHVNQKPVDKKTVKRNHGIAVLYGKKRDLSLSNTISIKNNKITGTKNTGIYVASHGNVIVEGNELNNIGLHDGVKISGGILFGNTNQVIIRNNKIENFSGSFEERGAIAGLGGDKTKNKGSIEITDNHILNSSSGITLDQNLTHSIIENNTLSNIEKSDIFIQSPFMLTKFNKEPARILINNNKITSQIKKECAVKLHIREKSNIIITNNTIKGNENTVGINIYNAQPQLSDNSIIGCQPKVNYQKKNK